MVGRRGALWGGVCISRKRQSHTRELVMAHIAQMNESCHTDERVGHVTHMDKWVVSHKRINEQYDRHGRRRGTSCGWHIYGMRVAHIAE